MARYNPYNRGMMYPDIQDTPQVPYISYYDPQQVERLGNVIQQRGQRYDAAQAAIAKYLEEAGATEMRGPDRDAVIAKITSDLENVKSKVKERYNGDYGLAVNDVIQGLSKSSGIYKQAAQKYKEEQKYLPLYQKLKSEGKLVTPKGYNPFEQSAFDEETGRFRDIDYSQMYERNDYNKWVNENISNRLNQHITDNIDSVVKTAPDAKNAFIVMTKTKGFRPEDIAAQVTDADVDLFLRQNPTYAMEFEGDKNAAKQFLVETAKNQVYHQIDKNLTANPYWTAKKQEEDNANNKLAAAGPFVGRTLVRSTGDVEKERNDINDLITFRTTGTKDYEVEKKRIEGEGSKSPMVYGDAEIGAVGALKADYAAKTKKFKEATDAYKNKYYTIWEQVKETQGDTPEAEMNFLNTIKQFDLSADQQKVKNTTFKHADFEVNDYIMSGVIEDVLGGGKEKITRLTPQGTVDKGLFNTSSDPKSDIQVKDKKNATIEFDPAGGRFIVFNGKNHYQVDEDNVREDVAANMKLSREVYKKFTSFDKDSNIPIKGTNPEPLKYRDKSGEIKTKQVYPMYIWQQQSEDPRDKVLIKYYVDDPNKGTSKDNIYYDSKGQIIKTEYNNPYEFIDETLNKIYVSYNPSSKKL